MRLYYFVSYRIALFSPGYSPINEMCNGKCAQVSLPLLPSHSPSLSPSCSSTSSDIFRKISTKIYSILAEYLFPSLSHLTHIHATATGSGSFFLSRLSSLASHLSRFSKFLRCFFPSRHLHFSSFWVIYDSPWRAGTRSLVIYSIIFDSFLLCCDISRLFLNRTIRK